MSFTEFLNCSFFQEPRICPIFSFTSFCSKGLGIFLFCFCFLGFCRHSSSSGLHDACSPLSLVSGISSSETIRFGLDLCSFVILGALCSTLSISPGPSASQGFPLFRLAYF
uniref:Uncharacterized protein n=1 Tax=Opuntia streptacantha TaxID=393608 RepID=A0A7C9E524_OPUST